MRMFPHIISEKMKADFGLDIGIEFIRTSGGKGNLEAVTSNPRSLEGGRVTFALLNEALWTETAIPTPNGFVRMGDLEVGDLVYGKDGVPTPVTHVTDIQEGRACFRAELPNGDFIVASEGHLWSTKVSGSAALPRVRTTLEMVEDGRRFQIPRAGVRHSSNTSLPLDPYILGAWLGDGSTGGCNITIGDQDADAMCAEFARRGVPLHALKSSAGKAGRFGFSAKSGFGADMGTPAAKALRSLPCYRDKHIPDEYMVSGHEQRLELLRGLMDTDGCVTDGGYCIFTGTERLSWDVKELASSLGFLPFRKFVPDSRSRHGGVWVVRFLLEGENPFSLPRKRDRVAVKERRKWVRVDFEEVPSVPVRCIEVADEHNRLYQADMAFVTHNTQHWVQGNSGIEMYLTADNNAAKLGNRYLAITNAYVPGEDSAAERMRLAYERILEGLDEDLGFMYDSLEAHEGIPLTKEGLRFAIPIIRGDSLWCKPDNVIPSALRGDMPPARARRMYLNQIVAGDDKLWTEADIKANKVDDILRAGDKIVLGFDGGKSDDATVLIAIRVDDGFIQPLLVEEKPTAARAKGWEVSHEKVHSVVSEAFRLYQVQGFYADVHLWEDDLISWTESYGPQLLVRASSDRPIHWDMRGGPANGGQSRKVIYAHEALISNWNARSLRHRGGQDPLTGALRRHMLNAVRRDGDFGVGFSKESPESPKKIDAYSALVLANACLNDYRAKDKGKPKTGRAWWI